MLLTQALALLLQVGPNPSPSVDESAFRVPSTAGQGSMTRAQREVVSARQQKERECYASAQADAGAALRIAQSNIGALRGEELTLAQICTAHALYAMGNFAEAAGNFQAAYGGKWDGTDRDLVAQRTITGNAQLLAGDAAAALATYDALLSHLGDRVTPELARSFVTDRAIAQVLLGQLAEAELTLSQARKMLPESPAVWMYSATLSRRVGKLDMAQQQIERAADLEVASGFTPLAPSIGLEAGLIAAMAGNDDVARKSWQSVIDLAPESAQAKNAQSYIEQLDAP